MFIKNTYFFRYNQYRSKNNLIMIPLKLILFVFFLQVNIISAQSVPKKVIVEHFTNTRCPICASNNPGFYAALDNKPNVLHIAYHPSSPYSTCLFSTQNKSENDARTNFYGVYGGTPVFVVNGDTKYSSEVQSATIYQSYENQGSPLSININISPATNDSISVLVSIKAVMAHNLSNLSLYIPLTEDTVFYNAPNGENKHYDVFRKSFTGSQPVPLTPPGLGGNPVTFSYRIAKKSDWNLKRLAAIAIITDMCKKVVQAASSDLYSETVSATFNENLNSTNLLTIYPNPAFNTIQMKTELNLTGYTYAILNSLGQLIGKGSFSTSDYQIDIRQLPSSLYRIRLENKESGVAFSKSFIKL